MYSGFITARHTADWLGAHQKFNKLAYRQLVPHVQMSLFPPLDKIQHFEGYNGPDGLKVKSAHRHEELSHFYDPIRQQGPLLEHVDNHYHSLVKALRQGNVTRAAFEASWLAHTVADGLTPAHHYPYEEELHEMYSNSNQEFRKRRHKIILQGENKRHLVRQNWQMWGGKGLLSTHIHFELGVATAVIAGNYKGSIKPTKLKQARKLGAVEFFKAEAAGIHRLGMYEMFSKQSWTVELARMVRHQLAPAVIQAVAIEWIMAAEEAGVSKS